MAQAEVGRQFRELPEVGDCGVQVDPSAVREHQLVSGDDGSSREPAWVVVRGFPRLPCPGGWWGNAVRHRGSGRPITVPVLDVFGRCGIGGCFDGGLVRLVDVCLLAVVVVSRNWLGGRILTCRRLAIVSYFGGIGVVGRWCAIG